MNSLIGIKILFLVCIVAVIATIIYKTRQSSGAVSTNDNPETLKINADGTLSFMESKKEYFMYVENSNGTKYTEDDPVHVRYYKNKATRGSIWNGMKTTSADMVQNTPCDEPDCVFVDTADRDTTTVLLNDIMDSVKPGLKDYRNYLYSKGLTNAIYKQQSQQMVKGKFNFDILFKGYLEYKGITVPDDLTLLNHSGSEFFKEIIKTFPIVAHWNFIGSMLTDALLKVKDDGKTALYLDNHAGDLIEINIGAEMDLFRGVFIIGVIKILIDNKDIGRVIYDPPAVVLSYKQINKIMGEKMSAASPQP